MCFCIMLMFSRLLCYSLHSVANNSVRPCSAVAFFHRDFCSRTAFQPLNVSALREEEEKMAADFPNFPILDDEMFARRLDGGRILFDDIDLGQYLEMAGLSEQLELGVPGECLICFERKLVKNRPCCDLAVCRDCLKSYYASLVRQFDFFGQIVKFLVQ